MRIASPGRGAGDEIQRVPRGALMKCRENVERIEEICRDLLEIIDDSRAHCDNDECELIHCVVHDCVQKMLRVTSQWRPEERFEANPAILGTQRRTNRSVN